jgi:hypothetical protein
MKTMRNILTVIAVLLGLALAPMAGAQQYEPITLKTQGFIAPSTASNCLNTIGLTRYDQVVIQVSVTSSNPAACWNGAGNEQIILYFKKSVDGTSWSGTNGGASEFNMTIKLNTNAAYARDQYVTNFTVNSVGYLQLNYITNACTIAHVTNVVVKYAVKPRRDG